MLLQLAINNWPQCMFGRSQLVPQGSPVLTLSLVALYLDSKGLSVPDMIFQHYLLKYGVKK